MTAFWYMIVALGVIAAIVNFGFAIVRRKQVVVAAVRAIAGVFSLACVAGIVIGKALHLQHPYLQAQFVFIGFGIFVFLVLVLPSYADRGSDVEKHISLQQRAARPANATIRLRDGATDEWVN